MLTLKEQVELHLEKHYGRTKAKAMLENYRIVDRLINKFGVERHKQEKH